MKVVRALVTMLYVLLGLSGSLAYAEQDGGDEPLLWGMVPEKSSCANETSYLWVAYSQGNACVRYFTSRGVVNAPVVVVQFYGDRDHMLRKAPEDIRNNTRRSQERYAQKQADKAGVPWVVMARPGTYGSSGSHRHRRQAAEFLAINAALDVLKNRYGIKRFVLLGHSGGATVGAALLTLGRTDIRCAVLTSGAYNLLERARVLRAAAGKQYRPGRDTTGIENPYDPLDYVGSIAHDPQRLIYVLGNVNDKVTPFEFQRQFAQLLAKEGHAARLMEHRARAPQFHNLQDEIGLKVASGCAK